MTEITTIFESIIALASIGSEHSELAADMNSAIGKLLGMNVPALVTPTLSEMEVFRTEGKVRAIVAHRTRTGLGLKESKEAIDAAALHVFGTSENFCGVMQY